MPPIAQYVFNGVVTGGILALPAVAFSLLWRLLRFPNFAVSPSLAVGASVALVLNHGARASRGPGRVGALPAARARARGGVPLPRRPARAPRPFPPAVAA